MALKKLKLICKRESFATYNRKEMYYAVSRGDLFDLIRNCKPDNHKTFEHRCRSWTFSLPCTKCTPRAKLLWAPQFTKVVLQWRLATLWLVRKASFSTVDEPEVCVCWNVPGAERTRQDRRIWKQKTARIDKGLSWQFFLLFKAKTLWVERWDIRREQCVKRSNRTLLDPVAVFGNLAVYYLVINKSYIYYQPSIANDKTNSTCAPSNFPSLITNYKIVPCTNLWLLREVSSF